MKQHTQKKQRQEREYKITQEQLKNSVLNSLKSLEGVVAECRSVCVLLRCFGTGRRHLEAPFIAPSDLGVIRASFGSFTYSLSACASDCLVAHRTVHSTTVTRSLIGHFPLFGGGAPDCPVLQSTVGADDVAQLAIRQVALDCPLIRPGRSDKF
jgi:hypothetical protein